MSAGIRRTGLGCLEVYQASLERRIQQGEWDLVCREEELCKEMETRLSECSPQNFHAQLGFDTLSVIEASLRASHNTDRLRSIVKAFEVLERAALNLYLCPWRKEYRVVKMFSGMFTHCIKPALPAQQAKELFALLGYQSAGSDEEELRLSAHPVHSHILLQLACGFFTARLECQLLLTATASVGGSMECVLQLIHERKRGCTFQTAVDSAKRKLEPSPCDEPLALDATLDLYTDTNLPEHGHMASPPSLLYIPPPEDPLPHKMSNKERNEKVAQTVTVSTLTYQISPTPQKTDSSLKPCENERQVTATSNAQHMMDALSQTTPEQTRCRETNPKDDLKQHSCLNKPSNDFFYVCHDCHNIHDIKCEELQWCFHIKHNVQNTGRLQPAQVVRGVTAHTCFNLEDTNYVVCYTCDKSHNYLCDELESCKMSGHIMRDQVENNEQAKPLPLHQCCISTKPNFACLNCKVFHAFSCNDNQCQRQHSAQRLKYVCCTCSDTEVYILCRYCCAQHCKNCWFKSPLYCICGMPFIESPV